MSAMSREELLAYLFDDVPHPLAAEMSTWLASRRFASFVGDVRTKIRKKIRGIGPDDDPGDLRLELETARLLLRERSLRLVYEPLPADGGRGPDFAVVFPGGTALMIEVTRLRCDGATPAEVRLGQALCGKLGQLQPAHPNVVVVGFEATPPAPAELRSAMLDLLRRAEAGDPEVVRRHGFRDRGDFFRHFLRLGSVLARAIPLPPDRTPPTWHNPQTRHPLTKRMLTALLRSHTL